MQLTHTWLFSFQIKYADDLGISSHKSSWMYFIAGCVSVPTRVLIGRLCDSGRVSFYHIFQFGVFLLAVADILLPLASQVGYLYAYAVFQGLCEALYFTATFCQIMSIYPKQGIGWLFFFCGIPIFIASGFAGQLIRRAHS